MNKAAQKRGPKQNPCKVSLSLPWLSSWHGPQNTATRFISFDFCLCTVKLKRLASSLCLVRGVLRFACVCSVLLSVPAVLQGIA